MKALPAFAVAVLAVGSALHAVAQTTPAQSGPADPPTAQAPNPRSGTTEASEVQEDGFEWDISWKNWHGLDFYASGKTGLKQGDLPLLDFSETRLAASIGGRLEVDGAAYRTDGSLSGFDDGFDLRRARVTVKGTSLLAVPFSYHFEFGYVPGSFTVNEAYVAFADVPHLGRLQVGQFTPPSGLQLITSSWDIGLMEPAAPLQAMAPPPQPGVQASDIFFDRRGTWTAGAFAGIGADGEYGSGTKQFGNFVGRATWLAIDGIDDKKPAVNHYLHLGASTSLQRGANGQLRYRSRPESYLAPHVIDTGVIDTDRAATVGVELMWTRGPYSAQAEAMASRIDSSTAGTLYFHGSYAQVGWFITGESRPYLRNDAVPGRIRPLRYFGFGPDAGWGAWEAVARVSYADLSDGAVQGGRLLMFMSSLNWILRPQVKLMFELGAGRVSGTAAEGNLLLAQMRMGVYYY
jgi:phosphate-selective porin OprO/OprP